MFFYYKSKIFKLLNFRDKKLFYISFIALFINRYN
jgi:hypothetical protein